MGFLDQVDLVPLPNEWKEGKPFKLEGLRPGPTVSTKFGDGQVAILTVEGEDYCLFGQGILRQANEAKPEEFPAEVRIIERPTKTGNAVKLLVPADWQPATTASDDDIPF